VAIVSGGIVGGLTCAAVAISHKSGIQRNYHSLATPAAASPMLANSSSGMARDKPLLPQPIAARLAESIAASAPH
jgi:hypothetical protein